MLPPISDDEAALLRAVCLDPWDDLPRLVIADWYEEHGEGLRAALIRAQCEYARNRTPAARRRSWSAHARFVAAAGGGPGARTLGAVADLLSRTRRGWSTEAVFGAWANFEAAADAGAWARVPVVRAGCPQSRAWVIRADLTIHVWARGPSRLDSSVPPRVFDRLTSLRFPRPTFVEGGRVGYGDNATTLEALSRAMVDEGRAAAGLPPLPWPAFPDQPG